MTSLKIPTPPEWKRSLFTVGVTGTNGKTSTTAWIAAALATVARPVARTTTVGSFLDDALVTDLPRDYNGYVALMRRCLDQGGRFVAAEYTSEALALGFAKAWCADVAVFTNLTHDHLDAHGTPEHYLASKAQLFMALPEGGTAVLNAAADASALIREVIPFGVRVVSYAVPARGALVLDAPDLVATKITSTWDGTRIFCDRSGFAADFPMQLTTRAIGSIYAENVLAALLGAVAAGVAVEDAARAIAEAPPPPGRFEVVARAPYVVVDYAHTPDALERTLAIARSLAAPDARVTVVFGAGGNRDKNKRAPMGAAASSADRVILTSDNPRTERASDIAAAIKKGVRRPGPEVIVELDRRRAIARAIEDARGEDIVLIAGRGHETEQIIGDERFELSDVAVAREVVAARPSR